MKTTCSECGFTGDSKKDFKEKLLESGRGMYRGERHYWGLWGYSCPKCEYGWVDEDSTI